MYDYCNGNIESYLNIILLPMCRYLSLYNTNTNTSSTNTIITKSNNKIHLIIGNLCNLIISKNGDIFKSSINNLSNEYKKSLQQCITNLNSNNNHKTNKVSNLSSFKKIDLSKYKK